MREGGVLFHAKHAYMPNALGYCGPDDRGTILQHLESGKGGEALVSALAGFEAAYPFLRLIAKSTGREVFDYSVPEAYWIGNGLLGKVGAPDFHGFTHRDLRGRSEEGSKKIFKEVGGWAPPHHTFYVMSTYATSSLADGPNVSNSAPARIARLIDDCRISWGKVARVGPKRLEVECSPVTLRGKKLGLGETRTKSVNYNPEVRPFASVRKGDFVSLHWDYACEVLTPRQVRNLKKYTAVDLELTNRILDSRA